MNCGNSLELLCNKDERIKIEHEGYLVKHLISSLESVMLTDGVTYTGRSLCLASV